MEITHHLLIVSARTTELTDVISQVKQTKSSKLVILLNISSQLSQVHGVPTLDAILCL